MAKKTRKNHSSSISNKKKKASTMTYNKSLKGSSKKRTGQSAKATIRGRQNRIKPDILIKRTSGRKEKFDINRMTQTTGRSGVPFLIARDIAKKVSKKIRAEAKEGRRSEKTVTAGRVRKMVAEELMERNRTATASSYSGERPENTRQGRHALVKENQPMHDAQAANKSKLLFDSSSQFAKSTRSSKMKS